MVDTINSINFVTAATYAPHGAVASLTMGASVNAAQTFNSRMQPLQMYYTVGTISPTTLSQLQGATCPTTTATIMSRLYDFRGSSEGRFTIRWCPGSLSREEIEGVGFEYGDLKTMLTRYSPQRLRYGYNQLDGEEISFIPNPGLGLWSFRGKLSSEIERLSALQTERQ